KSKIQTGQMNDESHLEAFGAHPMVRPCVLFLVFTLATPPVFAQIGTLATVSGKIVDLTRHPNGKLLFCTDQANVGFINTPGGGVPIPATTVPGPFPLALRGVVGLPGGDVAVIDTDGDIYRLTGGSAPAVKVYDDLYMISAPTDFIVDAWGNY